MFCEIFTFFEGLTTQADSLPQLGCFPTQALMFGYFPSLPPFRAIILHTLSLDVHGTLLHISAQHPNPTITLRLTKRIHCETPLVFVVAGFLATNRIDFRSGTF